VRQGTRRRKRPSLMRPLSMRRWIRYRYLRRN
jgi:hypothetical protein